MKRNLFSACFAIIMVISPTMLYSATFGPDSAHINHTYLFSELGASSLHVTFGFPFPQFKYDHVVRTEIVDGVKCVRIIALRTEASVHNEVWIAQDVNDDVYILKYLDAAESPSPVVLGKDNAVLMLTKNIEVGDIIFAGNEKVTHMSVTVPQLSTGQGPFSNCMQTLETDGDIVYYAPGYGRVKKEYDNVGSGIGWELKEQIFPESTKQRVVVIPLN